MNSFVCLRLITLPAHRLGERDALITQLRQVAAQLKSAHACWIAPVIDAAAINAGHIVWRMEFDSEAAALQVPLDPLWNRMLRPLLTDLQVTTIGYRVTRSSVRAAGAGIWRALLFRVMPAGFPDDAAALEAQLLLLPKYVAAIRSWALSTVAFVEGPRRFTHVWEQEFDELSGLTVDYMVHPVHWGLVDAWFDAESPSYVVDPQLAQVVGSIDQTIMR